MKKLVSLSPSVIEYVNQFSKLNYGTGKKFSESLNRIVLDHMNLKDLKEVKKDIMELKNETQ